MRVLVDLMMGITILIFILIAYAVSSALHARKINKLRRLGANCGNCKHFDHCDPDDDEGPDGYCCHPFHQTRESAHYDYGGHWTHSRSVCDMWEGK